MLRIQRSLTTKTNENMQEGSFHSKKNKVNFLWMDLSGDRLIEKKNTINYTNHKRKPQRKGNPQQKLQNYFNTSKSYSIFY